MSYQPLDFISVRTELLDEYRNQVAGADINPATEIYARVSVLALAVAMMMEGIRHVEQQIFPDSADSDVLERHAGLYGLARLDAVAATGGEVELTGVNGTVVASGLTLTHEDGTEYVTTSGGTIASGVLTVGIDAVTVGVIGNKQIADELTVQSPPVGVDVDTAITTAPFGGSDDESDARLAARVITRMKAGNAGGTHTDYEQWAGAVDGVLEAHTLERRLGAGTVTVAVFVTGGSGYRQAAGAGVRSDVAAAIEDLRPVCADVDVPAVTEVPVNITVSSLSVTPGYDETEVQSAVEDAIEAFVFGLETGDTLVLKQLGRAIATVAGVYDFDIDAPLANVPAVVDRNNCEILVPGTITVGLA